MSDQEPSPNGPDQMGNGSTADQAVSRSIEMVHWIGALRQSGLKGRSVAFALGVAPHTVRRWQIGAVTPSSESVAAVRLLVLAWRFAPSTVRRLFTLTAAEFAQEVNSLQVRALSPLDIERRFPGPSEVRHG